MKDSGSLAREREDCSIPKGKHEVKDSWRGSKSLPLKPPDEFIHLLIWPIIKCGVCAIKDQQNGKQDGQNLALMEHTSNLFEKCFFSF